MKSAKGKTRNRRPRDINLFYMKLLVCYSLFVLFTAGTALAQPGMAKRTVAERVAIIHAKMDSAFHLAPAVAAQVDSIFTDYYRGTDQVREELMSGGEPIDREMLREKIQPLNEAREKRLKKTLTEKQYETWKKEIEPTLRPQRPNRGN